jgi:predicted NodU family carbamoyl transferase
MTYFLGFKGNSDEGKVMVLASFGDLGGFNSQFKELINITVEGFFSLNFDFFNFHKSLGNCFP